MTSVNSNLSVDNAEHLVQIQGATAILEKTKHRWEKRAKVEEF